MARVAATWSSGAAGIPRRSCSRAEGNSDCSTSTDCSSPDSTSLRSEEFIDRVNELLQHHQGTGVQVFEVHFVLNCTHPAHLDKWVQFASKSDAKCVRLHLCKYGISCSRHSVTANRYNFPLHCFGDGQASSWPRGRNVMSPGSE